MESNTLTTVVGGYRTEFRPLASATFDSDTAVYIVLCVNRHGTWTVLDVDTRDGLIPGARQAEWCRECQGEVWAGGYEMPNASFTAAHREQVVNYIRKLYLPPCGG